MKLSLEKATLNLPLPIYLAGYANRTQPATEVHDPLYLNLFYVENATTKIASFSIDLLGIYKGQYDPLISGIKQAFADDIKVIISCVHSHATPDLNIEKSHDLNKDKLKSEIIEKAIMLIKQAQSNAKDLPVRVGSGKVSGVGANRRSKDVLANTILNVINFANSYVVNFNCHPTLLSEENLLVSKDYQGYCMDYLLNKGCIPMYLQGACGDISTRFTRFEQSFDEAQRIGYLLGESVLKLPLATYKFKDFKYHEFSFELPKKEYHDDQYYQKELANYKAQFEANVNVLDKAELRILETAYQGSFVEMTMAKNQDQIPTTIKSTIIIFDDTLAIVYLPFELFSKIQDQIVKKSKYPHTFIIGYTFDGLGYLPDSSSFDDGGYEVLSSGYKKEASDVLITKVVNELNRHD